MKIKDRYFENELIGYIVCLLFGIFISITMTMLSIESYYLKNLGFGFLVVIAFISYIWTLICITIGIREIVVIRNNQILNEINSSKSSLLDKIELSAKFNNYLYKELEKCKKMKE